MNMLIYILLCHSPRVGRPEVLDMKMTELTKTAVSIVKKSMRKHGYNMRGLSFDVNFQGYGFVPGAQTSDGRSIICQEIVSVVVRRGGAEVLNRELGILVPRRPFDGFN